MPIKGSSTSSASRIKAHTIESIDGCLLWTASVSTQSGYPMCYDEIAGRMDYAYAIEYRLENGPDSLDGGLECHHTCLCHTCLRHVVAVTRAQHAAIHKAERAERNEQATPLIRNLASAGRDAREIKALTGTTLGYIKVLLKSDAENPNPQPSIDSVIANLFGGIYANGNEQAAA
jgi:hypothetical protein